MWMQMILSPSFKVAAGAQWQPENPGINVARSATCQLPRLASTIPPRSTTSPPQRPSTTLTTVTKTGIFYKHGANEDTQLCGSSTGVCARRQKEHEAKSD